MTYGVFVLGYAQTVHRCETYLSREITYQQDIDLCRSLLDDIIVIARRRPVTYPSQLERPRLEDVGARLGFELPDYRAGDRIHWPNLLRFFLAVEYRQALARLFRDADLIYVEAPSFEGYLAAQAARQAGRRFLLALRGDALLNQTYLCDRFGTLGIIYRIINTAMFRTVRQYAFAGLYVSHDLMQRYPIAGPLCQVIRDVDLVDDIYQEPKVFHTPARKFLFVGHLANVKRVDRILDALHRASPHLPADWSFDIVGDGPDMISLQQQAAALGIDAHVTFHGRVPWGDAIFKLYHQSDMLLMASTSEGCSRTMLEAMASGLPVISTAVGTAPEFLDPRVVVPIGDVARYVQVLRTTVSDTSLLTTLSHQNVQRAQDFRGSLLMAQRRAFYQRAIEMSRQERRQLKRSIQ